MNNNSPLSLFEKSVPTMDELLEFVSQQFALEMNEKQFHRQALAFIIRKFIFRFEDKKDFWRKDNIGSEFPWDDYKTTLTNFLREKSLWGKAIVNNNLKQEHICVLFYIAALRYRTLPLPILQKKYDDDNQSQNPNTDLFLFNGNGEKKAAFALQPRLLTKSDMEQNGELKHESYRSLEYLGRDLTDSQAVREEGVSLAESFCYAQNNKGAKTRNFVVSVDPYKIIWDDCGVYEETLTSQTLDSAQTRPQNQMDPNQNVHNENAYELNIVAHQNSQSPPASQDQASQDLHFGQSYFKNKSKESQTSPKKNTNQSYLIIPRNSRDPTPSFNHFLANQLKPSSSYSQKSQKTSKPSKYSAKINHNFQNEGYFEENETEREERPILHPLLRNPLFKQSKY